MEGRLGPDLGHSGIPVARSCWLDHKHQGSGKGNNMTVSNDCGEQKEEQKKNSADGHHQLMVGETCIKVMESRNTDDEKRCLESFGVC